MVLHQKIGAFSAPEKLFTGSWVWRNRCCGNVGLRWTLLLYGECWFTYSCGLSTSLTCSDHSMYMSLLTCFLVKADPQELAQPEHVVANFRSKINIPYRFYCFPSVCTLSITDPIQSSIGTSKR